MGPMKPLRRRLLLGVGLSAVSLVAWLGMVRWSVPTVIDGYPIGQPAACADACPKFAAAASAWLDTTFPGHGPIDRIELFEPDCRDANGNLILTTRSGGRDYIAVIHADARVRAIQVGCGVGIDPDRCFTSSPMGGCR